MLRESASRFPLAPSLPASSIPLAVAVKCFPHVCVPGSTHSHSHTGGLQLPHSESTHSHRPQWLCPAQHSKGQKSCGPLESDADPALCRPGESRFSWQEGRAQLLGQAAGFATGRDPLSLSFPTEGFIFQKLKVETNRSDPAEDFMLPGRRMNFPFPRGLQVRMHIHIKLDRSSLFAHLYTKRVNEGPRHCSGNWGYISEQERHPCHSGRDHLDGQ